MSDDLQDATWHAEEMRLGYRRKEEWLDRRGPVATWFAEPWPGSLWIESVWAGMFIGAFVATVGAVILLA